MSNAQTSPTAHAGAHAGGYTAGGLEGPVNWALAALLALTGFGTVLMGGLFAASISQWTLWAWLALALVVISAAWIGGGAATALLGTFVAETSRPDVPKTWLPTQRTAVLITLCGESTRPVANYLHSLAKALAANGMAQTTQIFVLSDTKGHGAIGKEDYALADLVATGTIAYRRRSKNTGRKPGNIADWVRAHGDRFETMLVLDADSRMSADRMRAMLWRMEKQPSLGLLQAGIALVPGRTRFGRHQRLASRLLSPTFLRGFVAWTGNTGNYWGHNALIRLAAFRAALDLPVLPGEAPFGGPLLSHDFVEAAIIRRAGWDVDVDPEMVGSAEDAPQTLQAFSKRDRRWCQGNLQHIGIIGTSGLHPLSRIHLGLGVLSYIASPIWLVLLVMLASGAVEIVGLWPLMPMILMLLTPKFCALITWLRKAYTRHRRGIIVRAFSAELFVSALLAPLVMVRQTGAVLAVLAGRDCGWKSPKQSAPISLPKGTPEMSVGVALLALAFASGGWSALLISPVVLPLVFAPLLVQLMDASASAA